MEEPEVDEFDYEYRVDTDVITSVEVSGGQSDPDNPVTVQFVIEGSTYTISNVYYCQAHLGQTLEECCADYLAEQSQESPEMQM